MSINQKEQLQLLGGTKTITAQTFCELHKQYRARLLNSMTAFARNRGAAEDIVAAAFVSAFENLDNFRGESSFYTWLHAIALNEARSRSRNGAVVLQPIDNPTAKALMEPDILSQTLERSQCCARIREALRRVPANYRRILVDHFVRGYPVNGIAKRDRVPVGTVLSRIFNGKRLLRSASENAI